MRLAFWHSDKPAIAPVELEMMPSAVKPVWVPAGELDFVAIGQALSRKRMWIIVPTLLAGALSVTAVNMITPRYKSEVRILIDGRENVFLRPNGERNDDRNALDPRSRHQPGAAPAVARLGA